MPKKRSHSLRPIFGQRKPKSAGKQLRSPLYYLRTAILLSFTRSPSHNLPTWRCTYPTLTQKVIHELTSDLLRDIAARHDRLT